MKIVSYLDNNKVCKPATDHSAVYSLEDTVPVSKEQLCKKYAKVFSKGVGQMQGKYHIRLDSRIDPLQHAPWRVPVALRDCLKKP